MSKHTPGPWKAAPEESPQDEGWFVKSSSRPYVASVHWGAKPDETESNAYLIAAAPDLLEALEIAESEFWGSCETKEQDAAIAAIRAAIAKAKGESA